MKPENYLGSKIKIILSANKIYAQVVFSNIIEKAAAFFEDCPKDFLIQHLSDSGIVFGGTNRLIWRIDSGFSMDEEYCTQSFREHFEKIKEG